MTESREKYCDEFPISSPQTPVYIRRSRPDISPSNSPGSDYSPIPRRVSYGANSLDSPKTPRRVLRELIGSEKVLRQWIEQSLELEFKEKVVEASHSSPMKKMKEESSSFYYNLESGVILCKLLEKYFPSTIDYSKIHEFDERMYFISDKENKHKTSNYLSNARANIQLFLDGVRRIDGFPVLAFFSFEDLFLQQNKQSIISCLTNLHEFVSRRAATPAEDEEDDQMGSPTEDEQILNLEMTNRPALDAPITFNRAFGKSLDLDPAMVEEISAASPDLVGRRPVVTESASKALVSVFALPFVTLFLLLSHMWRIYQNASTTQKQ